ncbi:type III secretion effector protein [Pseudomonas sp. S10E 269]|nr:type III secretion effector protein [Pseudomonas sp. VS40]MBT1270707.1 type III secretion effector protein [Pseudomonas sp. VS59]PJK37462.1 type III secretion effector protein [Pseudomonas sp. S09F 262]PJK43191.1 type III secretion effector protein [Pseudomonas sp. S10E 269]USW03909.1 type III secretion effector protein [Pseudomonas pergaminensis]
MGYTPPYNPIYSNYDGGGIGGDENADLKALRKKEARESLIEGIEAYKITEQKKNIDAIR